MNCPECQNPGYAPHAASCSQYTPNIHRVDGGEVAVPGPDSRDADGPQTPDHTNGFLYARYGRGEWTDLKHLMWLHDRLIARYGEHPLVDYLHRLRDIIARQKATQDALTAAGYVQSTVRITKFRELLGLPPEPNPWPEMPDHVTRSVVFQGVCKTCITQGRVPAVADWIDCPTGGWWSHRLHPDDDHEADIGWEPEQSMSDQGYYFTVDRL